MLGRKTVVYQGRIATHNKNPFMGQIVIDKNSGLITEVIEGSKYMPTQKFDDSCLIFPGMGDIHIHAREDESKEQNYKEDYISVSNAALNGGIVHISAMPNTKQSLTTNNQFMWHRRKIKRNSHPISILNYVGIGKETKPIGKPREHLYKAYFGKSVGDLTFYDEYELEKSLQNYKGHKISFHVEYEPFIEASIDGKTHSERRPIGSINYGLKLLLPLIEKYKIDATICHLSTAGLAFELIEEHRIRAKSKGLPYTKIEVSPLYLLFDKSMTDINPELWLKLQVNPALQEEEHRITLIEGLRNGFIDFLATDHAPHTELEKYSAFKEFEDIFPDKNVIEIANILKNQDPKLFKATCCKNGMSGAPWLDTYANVIAELLMKYNFSPQQIAKIASYNPGKFINEFLNNQFPDEDFGKGFGFIEPGYIGSLTVINTDIQVITRDKLQTKVKWSPFEGQKFNGGLEAIIIRGKNVTGQFH